MKEPPFEITAIEVEGFKSIRKRQRLLVKPLTIIAGANSSGKSSLMQPLLLLKQTLESPFRPSALVLDGSHVRYSDPRQFISRCSPPSERFEVIFHVNKSLRLKSAYKFDQKQGLVPDHPGGPEVSGNGYASFDPLTAFGGAISEGEAVELANGKPQPGTDMLAEQLMQLHHLPGLRGNPERSYPDTSTDAPVKGPFPPYTASFLLRWQDGADQRLFRLAEWMRHLKLAKAVEAKRRDASRIEILISRGLQGAAGQDLVPIADVGLGVSQTLPMLVALLAAPKGTWVYIEQPELHLHPKAQAALAKILVEAAKRGAKVIAETHSSILVREIQTQVASRKIPAGDVALHWCIRNPKNGETRVIHSQPDELGRYGNWPADFGEVTLDTEKRYLKAVQRRRAG